MATSRYKVNVSEVDGIELPFERELPLDADKVFYDNEISKLSTDNVKEAVDQINAKIGATQGKFISTSFGSNSSSSQHASYFKITPKCYKSIRQIIYDGSSQVGVPSKIQIACKKCGYSTAYFRVYDITNNQVIAEASTRNKNWHILDLGELSNISSDAAIWEFQAKIRNMYFYISTVLIQW